ncbi:MAG TPA: FAD-dependent oxidoreductase [Hanamia sp.]|nr:FAD-dependent oxidoreductase [Hanamia sp.]
MIYDSIIIGAGLIGSAAAKYISESEKNVALIGPDEERALNEKIIFSSHYDNSRIQRMFGKDEIFTFLNQQSANEYDAIERETKIIFHSNEGCLYVNPSGMDAYFKKIAEQAKVFDIPYQLFQSGKSLHSFIPEFNFPASANGIFEPSPSGHINPRLLIKAQQFLFRKNGGALFNGTVKGVVHEKDTIKIETLDGKIYRSKKVLITSGAFINFFHLLKRKLLLRLKSETTILVKMNQAEAFRLVNLPSLLYKINQPEIQDIYLVRPIQYPDGNFYLKMGANIPDDIYFDSLSEVQEWFIKENRGVNLKIMKEALKNLIPKLSIEQCDAGKCIVSYTQHGKPYIGEVENGIFVAAGGNGYSAMCSDALGKIAANLLLKNEFPKGFFQKDFKPIFVT